MRIERVVEIEHPVGHMREAGGIFRVMQRSNWKVFYENLHDTMHARVTHDSSYAAARDEAMEIGERPLDHEESLKPTWRHAVVSGVDASLVPIKYFHVELVGTKVVTAA